MSLLNIKATFNQHFNVQPFATALAPGRVNLLGEHVDYNDGIVLPVAIDRYAQLAAIPTDNDVLQVFAVDLEETADIQLSKLATKVDIAGNPLPDWALYPAGVAWALVESDLQVSGMKVSFASNIPIGSGLSSSAAIEIGFATIFQQFSEWNVSPFQLAQICRKAENEYVGISCGLMDQFASACGVPGEILYLDTRTFEHGSIPLSNDVVIIIADTGIRRELSASEYNKRHKACELAVEYLRNYLPEITALRDVSTTEYAAYSLNMPEKIRMRGEHVVKEIARVNSAMSALMKDDLQSFGALMYAGHRSLRDLYEVSIPELDLLVDIAHRLPGCIGARLTGAGFGGCTVNIVEKKQAQAFINRISAVYQQESGKEVRVFRTTASRGAHIS